MTYYEKVLASIKVAVGRTCTCLVWMIIRAATQCHEIHTLFTQSIIIQGASMCDSAVGMLVHSLYCVLSYRASVGQRPIVQTALNVVWSAARSTEESDQMIIRHDHMIMFVIGFGTSSCEQIVAKRLQSFEVLGKLRIKLLIKMVSRVIQFGAVLKVLNVVGSALWIVWEHFPYEFFTWSTMVDHG